MACYAQTVNVIGCIKTTKTHADFDATAFPLALYHAHFGTIPVHIDNPASPVDISAALTDDKKALTVGVVNPTAEPFQFRLNLKNATFAGPAQDWVITGSDPMAYNQPGEKRNVDMHEYPMPEIRVPITVPPYSITVFRAPLQ